MLNYRPAWDRPLLNIASASLWGRIAYRPEANGFGLWANKPNQTTELTELNTQEI